ncbi:hypothetical protein DPMN_017208 [Dreissena polymorpha]|uniref:C2H2-type domain-containing protein n=1 Tax=Dreissena polymorpha TaxID=45954 RepID=A0A9D4S780_DREPO|nr:hypothetical protein DPMN_017208 [Dreissena polymorpha]
MESSNGDQIQCEVCGVALSLAYFIKRHMQLHSDSTYECDFPECGLKHSSVKKTSAASHPFPHRWSKSLSSVWEGVHNDVLA